jgi:hypothetical protein
MGFAPGEADPCRTSRGIRTETGRPKDRARLAYLLEIPDFDSPGFLEILARHNLGNCWDEWAAALDLSLR